MLRLNFRKEKTMKNDEEMIPYGFAWINGTRVVFNPYILKKGKNKGKIQCFYRKGSRFKKIILEQNDIKSLERESKEWW